MDTINGTLRISPNQVHLSRYGDPPAVRLPARSARLVSAMLGLFFGCFPLPATTVHIDNPVGSIAITVSGAGTFDLIPTSPGRPLVDGDVRLGHKPGLMVIQCAPEDKTPIDLELTIPYGVEVKARTTAGTIRLQGIVPRAELSTESGGLELISDWNAMGLYVASDSAPGKFTSISGLKLTRNPKAAKGEPVWELTDQHPDSHVTLGRVVAKAGRPDRIEISAAPFPEDAPVRPHWQATEVVNGLLSAPKKRARRPVGERMPGGETAVSDAPEEGVLFSSDVRIVDVPVSVLDSSGRPVAGLGKDDFEVTENGVVQAVTFLDGGESPFNLVLLLDLSGSTKQNRAAMKQAARRFIEVAGPRDRVAAYALTQDMLHVVSPLTGDHESLAKQIEALPEVSGGTPLYDAVALAYAQELSRLDDGRNALIVISDGVDNDLHGQLTPSKLSFKRLERAAREMNALIYPVLLDPAEARDKPPAWARKARERMERLAAATGGRLFSAASLEDLEPVYRQVAAELRSIYSLAYYPKDQDFDGDWREVTVKANQAGARLRFRNGYFSR